ncbi:hypothetical protein [Autumnicola psychrophila]|uniref:Uncharacterized protein n=1 Tax=Autumnicola psychrophila TaxID=3075592 RepID=A0ABU3DR41_9FLAO|nr:hypothetical protein [Zunongwangia sp. F225]MDT0686179.1 hypothetical protein [Zunongwangia sp. F225]
MQQITRRKSLILIALGMFVIAVSQFITRYTEIPDIAQGVLTGIGIGLLLTAILFGRFKTAR